MTIGKSATRSSTRSSARAPKFLDKASGFYGRFDEPEAARGNEEVRGVQVLDRWEAVKDGSREKPSLEHGSGTGRDEAEAFGFGEGMMEDDGESLLQRKPSRRSSRWRRSSRRKQKEADAGVSVTLSLQEEDVLEIQVEVGQENQKTGDQAIVHFAAQEEADDQILIREKKRGRDEEEDEEGEEERKMKREQEEGMKMVKRKAVKNYRKALDRAFRRGWEALITNLYNVSLAPMTPPWPQTSKAELQHRISRLPVEPESDMDN